MPMPGRALRNERIAAMPDGLSVFAGVPSSTTATSNSPSEVITSSASEPSAASSTS
jgi:hypothetical protein